MSKLQGWLEERFGLSGFIKKELFKIVPPGTNWLFSFGSLALFLFFLQAITGIFLALYYVPTPDHAYSSVNYISEQVIFGKVVRGMHHWTASLLMVVLPLHLLRVLLYGAYKKPREATWLFGVLLLLITFGFAFTGYLLPWDQKGYWATVVGTNIIGSVPIVGQYLVDWLKGGPNFGVLTLGRFYAIHILILPLIFLLFISAHIYLVLKHGTAGHWDPKKNDLSFGFSFYPRQIVRDLFLIIVALIVLAILVFAKPLKLEEVASPASTTFIPRPEWYFLFHFQLLKYFPGDLRVIATFVLPMVFLLMLLLVPLYDRRERKSPLRRPIALTLSIMIVAGVISLTGLAVQEDQNPVQKPGAPLSAEAQAGLVLFNTYGCKMCHGEGGYTGGLGPSLIDATLRHEITWLLQHFKDPKALVPDSKMPKFDYLTDQELNQLIAYLKTVK